MEQPDLDAIEARANAATEGPWGHRTAPREGESVEQKAEYLRGSLRDNGQPLHLLIAEPDNEPDLAYVIPALTGDGPRAEANAEFIAHARTDVPALVAALREARADRDTAVLAAVRAEADRDEARAEVEEQSARKEEAYRNALAWRARYEALRDGVTGLADRLTWKRPEHSPCGTPEQIEACCGSEQSCDAMNPSVLLCGASDLRAVVARVEGS